MKKMITLYYFSGTGNSLSIVKDLKLKLEDIKIISIEKIMRTTKDNIITGDIIGFVFPVYFGRVPCIIEEFLDCVDFKVTNYIFAIANGGGAFCRTLKIFNRYLHKKNRYLNAGFTISMPGVHPKVSKYIKKSNEEFYLEKNDKINYISSIISNKIDHPIETNFGVMGFVFSYFLFKKPYNDSRRHKLDNIFWTNSSCKQCNTCIKMCPVENIEMTSSGPKWLGKCVNCCRCYHLCPNEAIELGKDSMKRYINPDILPKELK
ncbi:MAG: EFR1 family ferrodoxin [Spirochaetaceae bacterium]